MAFSVKARSDKGERVYVLGKNISSWGNTANTKALWWASETQQRGLRSLSRVNERDSRKRCQRSNRAAFVIYCCITNYHQLRDSIKATHFWAHSSGGKRCSWTRAGGQGVTLSCYLMALEKTDPNLPLQRALSTQATVAPRPLPRGCSQLLEAALKPWRAWLFPALRQPRCTKSFPSFAPLWLCLLWPTGGSALLLRSCRDQVRSTWSISLLWPDPSGLLFKFLFYLSLRKGIFRLEELRATFPLLQALYLKHDAMKFRRGV